MRDRANCSGYLYHWQALLSQSQAGYSTQPTGYSEQYEWRDPAVVVFHAILAAAALRNPGFQTVIFPGSRELGNEIRNCTPNSHFTLDFGGKPKRQLSRGQVVYTGSGRTGRTGRRWAGEAVYCTYPQGLHQKRPGTSDGSKPSVQYLPQQNVRS